MNIKPDQKFFVFDVESIGLHGEGFAVAGGIYDVVGAPVREFAAHCVPSMAKGVDDAEQRGIDADWAFKNVSVHSSSQEFGTPDQLREFFWDEWTLAKQTYPDILMFVECGWPVEARFLIKCIEQDVGDRNWNGPYPLHEIATIMLAAGMDPMATYDRNDNEKPAHEPLADARLSARLLSEAIIAIQHLQTQAEKGYGG